MMKSERSEESKTEIFLLIAWVLEERGVKLLGRMVFNLMRGK